MKWKLKEKAPDSFFKKHSSFNPLLVQLLYNREIKDKKEIKKFLNPNYAEDTHDPFLMKGMKKAVARIKKAIDKQEKIAIFGDYDADGVCASALMYKTLKKIGFEPVVYIPDREKEGYGMSNQGIDYLDKKDVDLIITVDCGISDQKKVAYAQTKNIDVIVTDHHLIPDNPPKCEAVLNPQQEDCPYPFRFLSGTGVAFKLIQGLIQEIDAAYYEGFEKWFLDIVALATVADLMPLKDENRTLVKYGLARVFPKSRWIGLKVLLEKVGVQDLENYNFKTQTLGFLLGPRLNAAGRMDHANLSFKLLVSDDQEEAKRFADKLEKSNRKRQKRQKEIEKEIVQILKKKEKANFVFEGDQEWPIGLVGLAAGRITDRYYFPSCVYNQGKKICKGSCRSVKGVNIVDILTDCEKYLEEYGGHAQAAGFTVQKDKLEDFKNCFARKLKKQLQGKKLEPELSIDAQAAPQYLNTSLENVLEGLAPFGKGNSEPLFLTQNLEVTSKKRVGSNKNHLKLTVRGKIDSGYNYIKAIYFGWEADRDKSENHKKGFQQGKKYDIVFKPMVDEWRGRKSLTLNIKDFRPSQKQSQETSADQSDRKERPDSVGKQKKLY